MLTAEKILAADDLPFDLVEIPEWGGSVRVYTLSGHERNEFENLLERQDGRISRDDNLRVKLSAMCMRGDDGKLLFGPSQVDALGKKSSVALDRVYARALIRNGMSAEAAETNRKNSEGEPGGGSSST